MSGLPRLRSLFVMPFEGFGFRPASLRAPNAVHSSSSGCRFDFKVLFRLYVLQKTEFAFYKTEKSTTWIDNYFELTNKNNSCGCH